MQAVIRRTALAERQAARRAADKAGKRRSDERKIRNNEQVQLNSAIRNDLRAARTARREDWLLGPLAPRRDVGEKKDSYGAIGTRRLQSVDKADGDWKDWCIVAGDRVVIVEDGHRDRGKIAAVREIREKAEECVIIGLNLVDVAVPNYMLIKETDKRPFRTYEAPLPLSSVRLVYPLPHAETGGLRDTIIKELKRNQKISRGTDEEMPRRYIAGLNPPLRIPYPDKEPEEYDDHDVDTLRIEVEQKTWVPTLARSPMPPSIIDELRNKYSKFRDRHDDRYIAKMNLKEEEVMKRRKSIVKMMTPLQELHMKERAEKRARGKPTLSEETLGKIGEVMAKNSVKSTQKLIAL
ncbi:hypothetical protein MMC14_001923 [Varicellaria rhodocarpa]|nr:hypothetical protein [Varicellaria rhodocarpa]